MLDTGHFALEDFGNEIAGLMLGFLETNLSRRQSELASGKSRETPRR